MKLAPGTRTTFHGDNGRIVKGKVITYRNGYYLVAADCGIICYSTADGLFRFREDQVWDSSATTDLASTPSKCQTFGNVTITPAVLAPACLSGSISEWVRQQLPDGNESSEQR